MSYAFKVQNSQGDNNAFKVFYHQRMIEREIDFKVNFDEKGNQRRECESPRLHVSVTNLKRLKRRV